MHRRNTSFEDPVQIWIKAARIPREFVSWWIHKALNYILSESLKSYSLISPAVDAVTCFIRDVTLSFDRAAANFRPHLDLSQVLSIPRKCFQIIFSSKNKSSSVGKFKVSCQCGHTVVLEEVNTNGQFNTMCFYGTSRNFLKNYYSQIVYSVQDIFSNRKYAKERFKKVIKCFVKYSLDSTKHFFDNLKFCKFYFQQISQDFSEFLNTRWWNFLDRSRLISDLAFHNVNGYWDLFTGYIMFAMLFIRTYVMETVTVTCEFLSTITSFISFVVSLVMGNVLSLFRCFCTTIMKSNAPTICYLTVITTICLLLMYDIFETYSAAQYSFTIPPHSQIREGCKPFILDNVTLKNVMGKLSEQINLGLNPATREKSSVKCFNTYVQHLPTGKEKGKFLALDLGGTNFRVLLIKMDGRHYDMQSKIYSIPESLMTGPGSDLFEHIAECLSNFIKEHKLSNETLPLGFTFSFPLNQVGLEKGILVSWTKGFSCEGVVGKDVVALLKEAVDKKMPNRINIVAILNDTTGTLMSCAWRNHNCKIGLILGTGTNACYVEKISNVIGFDGDKSISNVIINTEWGAFGDHGELDSVSTEYDKQIDNSSINPGKQRHEKMISGMYLGEIVRLLICKYVDQKILFDGNVGDILFTKDQFRTEYVSLIESDKRGTFKNCRNVLQKVGIINATDQDCANIRYICECVSRRAAHLASAGLATLINKMQIQSVTVGVDGTLYRKHPHFHDLMMEKIAELVDPSVRNISLMLSEDGSGRGAALIAAAVKRSPN